MSYGQIANRLGKTPKELRQIIKDRLRDEVAQFEANVDEGGNVIFN